MFEKWRHTESDAAVAEGSALKSEHLKEGVKPIRSCIFNERNAKERKSFPHDKKALFVDFYGSPQEMSSQGFKNAGLETYAISPSDERNKFSLDYRNCTGVVAVGRDKQSGKEISFMSHQDPVSFIARHKKEFIQDMRSSIEHLKSMAEEGTIDAVVFGGNYFTQWSSYAGNKNMAEDHVESVKLLNEIIEDELGFAPVVMTGPRILAGGFSQAVYFDTQNRRLYILKPEDLKQFTNAPYEADKVVEERRKWNKE